MHAARKILNSTEKQNLNPASSMQIIAVCAGKACLGKTNIALNLSLVLAKNNKKVLLLDANLGNSSLCINDILGLTSKYNLSHVKQNLCSLQDLLLDGPDHIKLLSIVGNELSFSDLSLTARSKVVNEFNALTDNFDYLIIDSTAGIPGALLNFPPSSLELIIVTNNDPTSIAASYTFMKIMSKRYKIDKFHIIANMVNSLREGYDLFKKISRVAGYLLKVNLEYLGAIPFDQSVGQAIKKQMPVLFAYPDTRATQAFYNMNEIITNWRNFKKHEGTLSGPFIAASTYESSRGDSVGIIPSV